MVNRKELGNMLIAIGLSIIFGTIVVMLATGFDYSSIESPATIEQNDTNYNRTEIHPSDCEGFICVSESVSESGSESVSETVK
jgi:hypothetical protein